MFEMQLVLLALSVLAAVASMWFARRNNVRELQNTVDDLADWAEKAIRATRSARMRAVRAAAPGDDSAPPELQPEASIPPTGDIASIKKALRQKIQMRQH